MTYQLPPDLDQRVQSQIALGIYQTPAEVLNDALDALTNAISNGEQFKKVSMPGVPATCKSLDQFDAEFRAANGIQ